MCNWRRVFVYVINVGQEQKGANDSALRLTFLNWVLRVLNSTRGKYMNPGIFPQNLRVNNANYDFP